MILRSSKAVALVLIGSMSVLWGFKSCVDRGYYNRGYAVDPTQPRHWLSLVLVGIGVSWLRWLVLRTQRHGARRVWVQRTRGQLVRI